MKEPKDLGIKIGSKEEVFWTEMKEKLEADNLNNERQIKINNELLKFVNKTIEEEKEKFK